MRFCLPVSADGTQVGGGWGRAHFIGVADVDGAGSITAFDVHEVAWDELHDTGTEGSHHARIVRFLKEQNIEVVVAEHMGMGMQRVMAAMDLPLFLGAGGDARACVEQAAAMLVAKEN